MVKDLRQPYWQATYLGELDILKDEIYHRTFLVMSDMEMTFNWPFDMTFTSSTNRDFDIREHVRFATGGPLR